MRGRIEVGRFPGVEGVAPVVAEDDRKPPV